jgi:poly-gamma-glutamate system protein
MKGLFWRPTKVSTKLLVLVAVLAVCGLTAVELCRSIDVQPYHEEKVAAAERARRCLHRIKQEKEELGHQIRLEIDPASSGLIGAPLSAVTSLPGHLGAKQTSINPNFAAVVVQMLKEAGVKEGDCIAVGCTGSFPAMNVAVYSALETLKVRPIVITSAGASQYGANTPDLLWVDMERVLHEAGLISFRAVAASVGGYEDQGLGMTNMARQLIHEAIHRNGLPLIDAATLNDSVEQRMEYYKAAASGDPIRAYINVGGGAASVGRALGKKLYQPGLNLSPSPEALQVNSAMSQFARRGIPVLHFVEITQLAKAYGLPHAPTATPAVGAGPVFAIVAYHRWLAAVVLIGLLAALKVFVVSADGARAIAWLRGKRHTVPTLQLVGQPTGAELMV